jgi:hypothetical protein
MTFHIRTTDDWLVVLRARIAELGITHLECDHLAGLASGHTSAILCGMKKPTAVTVTRLCAALGLLQTVVVDPERDAIVRAEAVKPRRA